MNRHVFSRCSGLLLIFIFIGSTTETNAVRRRPPGGRIAVVVDERLSALRTTPELSGTLLRRLSRGVFVAVTGARTSREGIVFYRVSVTRRTGGWIQREAIALANRAGDDARLLALIKGSEDFDRIVRSRIFLDYFRLSPLRPEVLVIFSQAAEEAATHLSRDASRRLDEGEITAGGAPRISYFLNYNGLDRYNRQKITFLFDVREQRFRYDGEGWRELIHRYPQSPHSAEARRRLLLLDPKR